MEDFINIIFFIIAGVLFVFSSLGKKKKKKQHYIKKEINESETSTFDLFSEKQYVEHNIKHYSVNEDILNIQTDFDKKEEFDRFNNVDKDIIDKELSNSKKTSNKESDFDLKQAIIYETIINRKYF